MALTGSQIDMFRAKCLLHGLKLELKGMYRSKGQRTCYALIKEEFGLKGNKQSVHDQFEEILRNNGNGKIRR